MKKLLALLLLASVLAFAVSCGCQEDPEAGEGPDDPGYVFPDKDGNGTSDVIDGELPPIPLN